MDQERNLFLSHFADAQHIAIQSKWRWLPSTDHLSRVTKGEPPRSKWHQQRKRAKRFMRAPWHPRHYLRWMGGAMGGWGRREGGRWTQVPRSDLSSTRNQAHRSLWPHCTCRQWSEGAFRLHKVSSKSRYVKQVQRMKKGKEENQNTRASQALSTFEYRQCLVRCCLKGIGWKRKDVAGSQPLDPDPPSPP